MTINKLLTSYSHNTGAVERIKYIVIHCAGTVDQKSMYTQNAGTPIP